MKGWELEGMKVAITGPRKAEELSRLVVKHGGIPLVRPAQGTVLLDDEEVKSELLQVVNGERVDWFIFTTGVGIDTIMDAARNLGLYDQLLAKLGEARIAARGYKAIGALRKLGLNPAVRDPDGTTAGLVRAFAPHCLKDCRVALQLHGDPAPNLVELLEREGAAYHEILLYRHVAPPDEELRRLIDDMISGRADAVMFTSGAQVRFPFAYAREAGLMEELLQAFEHRTVAVAVGKYTADCLREEGVRRIVVPQTERMSGMVLELARYFTNTRLDMTKTTGA